MGGAYFVKYSGPAATPEPVIEADHAGRRMRPSGAGRQDRYLRIAVAVRAVAHARRATRTIGAVTAPSKAMMNSRSFASVTSTASASILVGMSRPSVASTVISSSVGFFNQSVSPCAWPDGPVSLPVANAYLAAEGAICPCGRYRNPCKSSKQNEPVKQPKGVPSQRSQPGDTISRQTTGPPLRRYASLQSHRHFSPIDGRGRGRLIRVKENFDSNKSFAVNTLTAIAGPGAPVTRSD